MKLQSTVFMQHFVVKIIEIIKASVYFIYHISRFMILN